MFSNPVLEVLPTAPLVSALPVPYATLEAAAARLRPDLAPPQLASKALAEVLSQPRWSYRYERTPNGEELVLTIAPSSATLKSSRKPPRPYEARATSCTCKGSFVRGCKHPTACLIVAEALEPTTTITGSLPMPLVRHALELAVATDCALLSLVASSNSGLLSVGCCDRATATVAIELSSRSRAVLAFDQQLAIDDAQRLLTGLLRAVPPDCQMIDIEIGDESLTLCAWNDDQVVWYDGAVLQPCSKEVPFSKV